jgi:hypothetical protein
MIFGIINAKLRKARVMDLPDVDSAKLVARLKPLEVDHGSITRNLHIIVYEFSLYVPVNEQHWFSIGGKLYGGNAVLYACDDAGETISLPMDRLPPILWFKDAAAVEQAIGWKQIERPIMAFNGEVLWQWPQPRRI